MLPFLTTVDPNFPQPPFDLNALPASTLALCSSLFDTALTAPSCLPLSVWAEQNIVLSPEYAARASALRLFGWQKEIMDSFTNSAVMDVTLMVSTQLIKTLFIQCALAYIICEDPGPILLVQPTDTDAKDFSRERLAPMIRDCACLHGLISSTSHDGVGKGVGSNRLQAKDFPGGNLSLVGAGAPGNLARRTIRYLFCDEVDKYKSDLKEEGDPISLAWERTATFKSRRKRIMCCSPTIQGRSRIGRAYKASDQRKPLAPCWKCGYPQVLHFFPDEKGGGVMFDSSLSRDRQAATAYYQCANCPHQWNDTDRVRSANASEWHAYAPLITKSRGFWISHLYSPWKDLSEIVQAFLDSKDDRPAYKTFINTNLALEWAEDGETPDEEVLYGRRESYPFGIDAIIPQRGLFLTAAVDVQDSPARLEVEVKAWGRGRENWSISYEVLQAFSENGQVLPVTSPELWAKLEELLQRNWKHESGHTLPILAMSIDTGSRPKPVYDFARKHAQLSYSPGSGLRLHANRTVIPVKGTADQLRIISKVSKEDAMKKRQGVRVISFGAHCAKQEIYDALKHIKPRTLPGLGGDGSLSGLPTPGACHFPMYDMVFFEMLCSEVRVVKDDGKVVYEQRNPRNETLDTFTMNRAAAACVGIDRFNDAQWRQLEAAVLPTTVLIQSIRGEFVTPNILPTQAGAGEAGHTTPSVPATAHQTQTQSQISSSARPAIRPVRGRF